MGGEYTIFVIMKDILDDGRLCISYSAFANVQMYH